MKRFKPDIKNFLAERMPIKEGVYVRSSGSILRSALIGPAEQTTAFREAI